MDSVRRHQQQLLDQARQTYQMTPISDAAVKAYLATPRHLFVRRYRARATRAWLEVNEQNLDEHVALIYADHPLILFGDDDDHVASTISQPSFVLRMLDLLDVRPGDRILELGTGSGWNAALLGHMVGPAGRVHSVEIIPELARVAAETIARLGITNVHVLLGDGGEGCAMAAPFDRIIFTAGAYDIPRHFYDQLKDGGALLAVIKTPGGGDNLFVLRKVLDHFESAESMPCGFVELTGKYRVVSLDAGDIETSPEWAKVGHLEVDRRPFWWGGKGTEWFHWQTTGIRSFLGITDPMFRAYKATKGEGSAEAHYFGVWDEGHASLVLARHDELISYGSTAARSHLFETLHQWVELGMPTASSFVLHVYRSDRDVPTHGRQWTVKRPESQFVWSISG